MFVYIKGRDENCFFCDPEYIQNVCRVSLILVGAVSILTQEDQARDE